MTTAENNLKIIEIGQEGDRQLAIQWSDGRKDSLDVVKLRKKCPCASCVDEWSGKPLIDEKAVFDSVRPSRIRSVGRYAVQIFFNDGHSTGFYGFPLLRSLAKKT